jgi:hypothetical protein
MSIKDGDGKTGRSCKESRFSIFAVNHGYTSIPVLDFLMRAWYTSYYARSIRPCHLYCSLSLPGTIIIGSETPHHPMAPIRIQLLARERFVS